MNGLMTRFHFEVQAMTQTPTAEERQAMSDLTPKQESFCQTYIETGNASEAYRRAYDCSRMKDTTVNRNAKRELDKSKIRTRIQKLQAMHRERHDITVDLLTVMLLKDRELARGEKKADAAINAVMAIAKLHGLVVEKKNLNVNADHQHHHTTEPLSESARWLEGVLGRGPDSPTRSN